MRGIADLSKDEAGSAVPLISALLLSLAVATAYSIDLGLWHHQRAEMQRQVDFAAYSAGVSKMAGDDLAKINTMLTFTAGLHAPDDGLQLDAVYEDPDNPERLRVVASRPARTFFAGWIGGKPAELSVSATIGMTAGAQSAPCMISLGSAPSVQYGIRLTNNAHIDSPNCGLHSNSVQTTPNAWTEAGSIYVRNGSINAADVCAVGQVTRSTNGVSVISPEPQSGCNAIPDPMQDYTPPAPFGGNQANPSSLGWWPGTKTLQPGVYPNGLSVSNGVSAAMAPGIYFVTGGDFVLENGAQLQPSDGVTVVMTSPGRVRISDGSSTMNWRAPETGPTAGLAFYRSPSAGCNQGVRFDGGTRYRFSGALYFPGCNLDISNNARLETNEDFTYIIADSIDIKGGARVSISANDVYGIPEGFGGSQPGGAQSSRLSLVR